MSNPKREPYLGEGVHYVAYGTPGGEFPARACRAAIVTDTRAGTDGRQVAVAVLNPTGLFFNTVPHDENRSPGTVHWAH